jgi:hypothetical protein
MLASAKGPVPSVAELVAGEPVRGSWWAHPKGREIFAALRAIEQSSDILVCRLIGGKVTFVHRRLWPALIRAAAHFPVEHLAEVRQEHTASGRHSNRVTPFPEWADADSMALAARLGEREALQALGDWAVRR